MAGRTERVRDAWRAWPDMEPDGAAAQQRAEGARRI